MAEYISNTELYIKEYFEVELILFLLDMFCQQVGDTYICQLVMDPVPGAGTWHLNFQVTRKVDKWITLKKAFKMQFRNAYFRLLGHSRQKLLPKPD